MDEIVRKRMDIKLENTKKALEKNNMNALIMEDITQVVAYLKEHIKTNSKLSVGGSQTLFECGLIDLFRKMPIQFEDRYKEGLSRKEITSIFQTAFTCDYYVASTNAISEDGELYNVDGNGNRVAAITFGPKHVILVVGENKIVSCASDAFRRLKTIAAPMNAKRLHKKTPCTIRGICMDCKSEERICGSYIITKRQTSNNKGRITILLVKQNLGY